MAGLRLFLLFVVIVSEAFPLSMDDFVPDFLDPSIHKTESSIDPQVAFSLPSDTQKRSASSGSAWYCNRKQDVFCNRKQESSDTLMAAESARVVGNGIANDAYTGANGSYFNRNSNNYDQNAVTNFNITNSNQAAMQVYSPKLNNSSMEDQLRNNVTVPVQAGKNTNVNIGQQQIEFNIQY